jgi:hypothetical protein
MSGASERRVHYCLPKILGKWKFWISEEGVTYDGSCDA